MHEIESFMYENDPEGIQSHEYHQSSSLAYIPPILLRQAILYVDTASAGRAKNTNISASASALSKTDISAGFRPVLSYKDVQNHPHFPFLF